MRDRIEPIDSQATVALKVLLSALQQLKHEYVRQHRALTERPPKELPAEAVEAGKAELMLRRAVIADIYNTLREKMS